MVEILLIRGNKMEPNLFRAAEYAAPFYYPLSIYFKKSF